MSKLPFSTKYCAMAAVLAAFLLFASCSGTAANSAAHAELKKPAGTITDPRDGKHYRMVRIGDLAWMAENLNYVADGSWCYDNDDSHCAKYGRLYTWDAASAACPAGWRLPADADWNNLIAAANANGSAGEKLKSKSGWSDGGNGTDDFGFSALPAGGRWGDGNFSNAGLYGSWWSAAEGLTGSAWNRGMSNTYGYVFRLRYNKTHLFSVRCVHD